MRSARSSSNAASLHLPLRMGGSCERTASRNHRRLMDLRGYARLRDGEPFAVKLVDLSFDGCKVETALALLPGTQVTLCLGGLGNLDGDVRWCSGGYAGLCFGQVEQESRRESRRREKRIKLDAQVYLRHADGASYPTRIFDFSKTGCRIEFLKRITVGARLRVRFEGWHALEADLRWLDQFQGGVEFAKFIEPPIFQVLEAYLKRFCVDEHEVGRLSPFAT